jgi:hypothetical protein
MKKILFILLFPFMSINAQVTESKNLQLGVFLQPEITKSRSTLPDGVGSTSTSPKIGVVGGFDFQFRLSKSVGFRSGLGFGVKRFIHDWNGLTFGGPSLSQAYLRSEVTLTEFQIPAHFLFSLKKGFYIALGAEFSGVLSSSMTRTLNYTDGTEVELNNTEIQRNNLSGQLGVGYRIPLQENTLLIEPYFKHYFSDGVIVDNYLMNVGIRLTYQL